MHSARIIVADSREENAPRRLAQFTLAAEPNTVYPSNADPSQHLRPQFGRRSGQRKWEEVGDQPIRAPRKGTSPVGVRYPSDFWTCIAVYDARKCKPESVAAAPTHKPLLAESRNKSAFRLFAGDKAHAPERYSF